MNYILYCAFGDSKYINMTIYSLLSYFQLNDKIDENECIVIFTNNDNSSAFKKALDKYNRNIIYEDISENKIKEWVADTNYMPRLKIKSLQYFFEKYDGNVLFIDSDTFIHKDIKHIFDKISNNQFILYSKCPSISNYLKFLNEYFKGFPQDFPFPLYKLCLDLESTGCISDGQRSYNIPLSFSQYNSGVIGMNRSHLHLLDEVLNLSDIIIKKYNYWCAEEFAFSYVIGSIQEIDTCCDLLYHYINDKWCRFILADLFEYNDDNDTDQFHDYIKENNLENLKNSISLCCDDIPYLIQFVRKYILKSGIDRLTEFYFEGNNFYSEILDNFDTYKKFEPLVKMFNS